MLANSSRSTQQLRVLKQLDSFLVSDEGGDILPLGDGSNGLYLGATRHLSGLDLRLGSAKLLTLTSAVKRNGLLLSIDQMNSDCRDDAGTLLPRGTLHFSRSRFLWDGSMLERVRVSNFGKLPVEASLNLRFNADFKDMFEIRGMERKARGVLQKTKAARNSLCLSYLGLDTVIRTTRMHFSPDVEIEESLARWKLHLPAGGKQTFFFEVASDSEPENAPRKRYVQGYRALRHHSRTLSSRDAQLESSNSSFNGWMERSVGDLHLMLTPTAHGLYPYAGIPWFNTAFGRDGILTAMQSLWLNPDIAKGVLAYLAATQAKEEESLFDAQPGKILHEIRTGEMVALREVPFEKYYGSIDSTPLFVVLAGSYFERTGDLPFIRSIWPSIQAALDWIDQYGDLDGDGLIEYQKRSPTGLTNQGWKDSHDCISNADGSLAKSPIALCEVQGYAYEAKRKAADIAKALGDTSLFTRLLEQAESLRVKFESLFWWEEQGTYALALDGDKKQCQVLSSNPGHCLFTGIVSDERAARVVQSLMSDALFSGWGIRTLGMRESRYNPMSYHNGSVWPHDTSIICEGFARYGFKEEVLQILEAQFKASREVDLQRMPELFCGFSRRKGEGPVLYPVACSPQAWAAGSVFLLLKACLGLAISARSGRIQFNRPVLPESVRNLKITNLSIGKSTLDVLLFRSGEGVGIDILRQEGPVEISLSRYAKYTH